MSFIIWIIAFVAAAIGTILANFIVSLGVINAPELIQAIVWFLISFITYFAGTRIREESSFGLISINFIVTWIFCTFGVILGEVVWILIETGSANLQLDVILTIFFGGLPLTIGPTATMSIGLQE